MASLFANTLREEDHQQLCKELYSAELEDEVINILEFYGLWDDSSCWRDYGDTENNVSIINNQTTNAEAALVEKFTNSIDSVLMKEAQLRGIDPKSLDAPQSSDEAMELFYGVVEQNLKTASEEVFEKLKNEITFVATGSEKRPTLAIIDKGEGQTPNMLSQTILSLQRSNKLAIKFVQGQFNQGGTAVLPFCGTQRFQLVISRRNQEIVDLDDESGSRWGFTIVRRNSSDQNSRNTRYEYLVINNKVPSFDSEYLDLLPGYYPDARKNPLESGTYIKLFEYNTNIKSYINLTLNYHLSLLLPGAKIPIHFYERRLWKDSTSQKKDLTSILYGHFYRFENNKVQLEKGFPYTFTIEVEGQHLDVKVVCFKRDKKRSFKSKEGVLFTLNGQTQGIMVDSFFDRKSVGLGYLKESLMVFVDASKLDVKHREDFFMSNRQHLREGKFKRDIQKHLEVELSQNKVLKRLQQKRRDELMRENANNPEVMQKTISKLIKNSPSLNILFNQGDDFKNSQERGDNEEDLFSYEGKEYPSYFRLAKEYPKDTPKHFAKNRSFRITFETDVEDLYFIREENRGSHAFKINGKTLEDYSFSLRQGKATFTCFSPDESQVGTLLEIEYMIANNNEQIDIFQGIFYVLIDQEVTKKDEDKETKKKPPKPQTLDLPMIYEVWKKEWVDHDFSDEDALHIVPNQSSYDFFINMDNRYLSLERRNKKDDEIRLNELFKGSLFLYALSMLDDREDDEPLSYIAKGAKAFSRVNLPIIRYGDVYRS